MDRDERVRKIYEAIGLVENAKHLVDEAVKGTRVEGRYKAYGRCGFNRLYYLMEILTMRDWLR